MPARSLAEILPCPMPETSPPDSTSSDVMPPCPRVISARSARFAARLFNYGNIIAMVLPLPLGIFWMGASMLVYALNRHHPNSRVGDYTQAAAHRLYGIMGFALIIAVFFGTNVNYWLATWAISALILVPWSILDLWRIHKEDWQDVQWEEE